MSELLCYDLMQRRSLKIAGVLLFGVIDWKPVTYLCRTMSRGRGGGRGGRGGGRGGFGGAAALPPMGLTFADIQNLSRDPTQLYPVCIITPPES